MCGIAGLVDLAGLDPAIADKRIDAAMTRIRPRGPDGHGKWHDQFCAFAHTRLAIIDLSPLGAQPMERDGLVITYNGEIFNYEVLRAELAALGHQFRSNSDTEIILAGWRQWGEGLLPRTVGMFAFAIWDSTSRTLFAARDRFGEKPFVYASSSRHFAFGSDLIACEAMLGETRPVDAAALRSLFTLRFVPEPFSIAAGVRKLPAGHWLRFDNNGVTLKAWYDIASEKLPKVEEITEAEEGLRRRFDAAVASRLVADVPVGVFLSSGLDSSLVAASVAAAGARLNTFTVGFEGAASYYEERPQAAALARHLGANHVELTVSFKRAGDALEKVFAALDEPFADSSAVPTFLVSEATRQNVSVVLTGDGADEVFGGYRRYWSELYVKAWYRLPVLIRQGLQNTLGWLPERKTPALLDAMRRLRRFLSTADNDASRRQANWMRLMPESDLDNLLLTNTHPEISLEETIERLRALAGGDPINAMLACDIALELPSDMLVKVDRMSMAHALETRSPFLDQRVVEWAFAIPGGEKLASVRGKPVGKRILRKAFQDRLPKEVFYRPKRGFEMPVSDLLLGPAASRLAAATDSAAIKRQSIFNPTAIENWKTDLSNGHDTSWQLWTILAFQEWARVHQRPEAIH